MDFQSIVRALGRCRCLLLRTVLPRDVIAASRQRPSRQPAGLPGCLAALGTRVWREKCKFAECIVRPRAPCRQSLFERPAGGVLQVPERQKKYCQFGGFAYPTPPPHSPFLPRRGGRPRAAPRKESRTIGSGAFLVLLPRGKSNRRVRGRGAPGAAIRKNSPSPREARRREEKRLLWQIAPISSLSPGKK